MNAHMFMVSIGVAAFRDIAPGAQAQVAIFFASDGETIIHPEPARFFEVPIQGPLPEELNYIQAISTNILDFRARVLVISGGKGR